MAEAATITCPECRKTFKGRLDLDGKRIRCKNCEHVFVVRLDENLKVDRGGAAERELVKAPGAKVASLDDEDDADSPLPYELEEFNLSARCPNCANPLEDEEAVICLHCGYNLQLRHAARTQKTIATTTVDQFVWLLPGLICAGSVVLLTIFCVFFCLGLPEMLPKKGFISFLNTEGARMWTVIPTLGGMWLLGKIALNRLILHPVPPEQEMH
jgi:hypothetical protein